MAKRASNKPAAKAAATQAAAVSTVIPASNEPAQPGAGQGVTALLSPEVLLVSPGETPPGVSGVSSPVAPSSIVVTDPAGDTYAEGDIPPEIVVGSEGVGLEYPPDAIELPPVAAKAPLEDHPAIELAQSFVTPHGKPEAVHGNYYTPPPPELRKPVKA